MNVKLKVLGAGAVFFLTGGLVFGQKTDSVKTKNIDEVVVMGYIKRKASEVTGSSVKLSSSDINTPAAISVDQAFQGKTPGVVVNASSGTPGSVQTVFVRGIGSMNSSNQPLYVVDGVPIINANVGGALSSESSSLTSSTLSSLASLNNEDIESVTVLKDASATALYGARGSNGVIVITTKNGRKGRTNFNLNTSIGFQNDAYMKRRPLTGDEKLGLLKQALVNQYGAANNFGLDGAIPYAVSKKLGIGNVNNWDGVSTDWSEYIKRRNALAYTADFTASGGNEKSTFYASLGYNRTEATVITPNPFERISGMLKMTRDLTDKVKLETSFNGSWITQNPILEQGGYFSNPYVSKILLSPWANPYNPDGTWNINNFTKFTSLHNIGYTLDKNINRNTVVRAIANTKVDYEIIKKLVFSTRINLDYINADNKVYTNRYHGDGATTNGYAERSFTQNYTWVLQNSLNYSFNVERHKFDLTGLYEYQKNQRDFLYGYGENFPADDLFNVASTTANKDATSTFYDWKNVSFLGLLNYSFANKFIVDASFRREGSSRFAPGHRFGSFWSVGAAYNMNKDFFQDVFDELKLRASYGVVGNSGVDLNQYQALLAYDADYDSNGAVYPKTLGNKDLTWEKNKTLDVGLSFGVLNNRLTGSVGYYNKHTYDLLLYVPLSRTTGFSSQAINAGAMTNRGVEAMLSYDIIKNENFGWNLSANIATVKNVVDKLAVDASGNPINPTSSSYKSTEIGQPFAFWYMPTWAGVNVETGAPEWYVNGVDGERTSVYSNAARHNQGTALPKYSGGISTNIKVKDFFVNASLYFAGGHKVYEQYAQWYMRTNNFTLASYNGVEELLTAWTKPGDITNVPKLTYNLNDNFHNTSSRHLYDGTFARLKDVTLGYNLPSEYLRSIGINGLTFTVRGSNLWTWVKDKGLKLDPETGNRDNSMGYTTLNTPPVKSVIFGFNFKF